jgi:hypothetical protein
MSCSVRTGSDDFSTWLRSSILRGGMSSFVRYMAKPSSFLEAHPDKPETAAKHNKMRIAVFVDFDIVLTSSVILPD